MIRKRKKVGSNQPAVKVMRDGREICQSNVAGKAEYQHRIEQMVSRQNGICCLSMAAPRCPGNLFGPLATFEHERGRGGGKRDDRIVLPDGRWQNGAAHWNCNGWKGSRFIDYNADRNKENGHGN